MPTTLTFQGKLKCGFCFNIQEVMITKSGGKGAKGAVSSQVSCEKCANYIPHKNTLDYFKKMAEMIKKK